MKPGQRVREPTGKWAEQTLNKIAEGKEHKFRGFQEASPRLPGGFPVFHTLYGHEKGKRSTTKSLTFAQCI